MKESRTMDVNVIWVGGSVCVWQNVYNFENIFVLFVSVRLRVGWECLILWNLNVWWVLIFLLWQLSHYYLTNLCMFKFKLSVRQFVKFWEIIIYRLFCQYSTVLCMYVYIYLEWKSLKTRRCKLGWFYEVCWWIEW